MSRYTGPVWKKSRRLGYSILETGKELSKRNYAPGQHGNDKKKKLTEYGRQLQEKQKVREMYGVNERADNCNRKKTWYHCFQAFDSGDKACSDQAFDFCHQAIDPGY